MRGDGRLQVPVTTTMAAAALRLEGLSRRWRKEIEAHLAAAGVSLGEAWRPLLCLSRASKQVYQKDLGEKLGIEPHLLGSLLDELEDYGLISRAYDRQDRRAKLVEITAAGLAMANRVESVLQEIWAGVFSKVSETEFETYLHVLDQIEAGLNGDLDSQPNAVAPREPALHRS